MCRRCLAQNCLQIILLIIPKFFAHDCLPFIRTYNYTLLDISCLPSFCVYALWISLLSFPQRRQTQREGLPLVLETPMEPINGNPETTEEALSTLFQSIILLLSRWNGLQMAVQNQWGGSDSLQKSQQLAADIFSWFSKSGALVPVEDLESLLHESMLLTFNTEIEDGSIEVVAEQLMAIHDEYLHHQSS